ncbi:chromatin remodeling [Fragilaria crotonensis]|nr:chromatin remodeling [Fragilaria crotonensis]
MSDNTANSNDRTLKRSPGLGMEPKSILIGDRLRHTVHNGALKLPTHALQLLEQLSVPLEGTGHVVVLPSVDSVVRPTLDKTPITVTFLREDTVFFPAESDVVGQDGVVTTPVATTRTLAVNQTWNPTIPDADRIRGGGLDDQEMPDAESENNPEVSDAPPIVSTTESTSTTDPDVAPEEPTHDSAPNRPPPVVPLSKDVTHPSAASSIGVQVPPAASDATSAAGTDPAPANEGTLDSAPKPSIPALTPAATDAPVVVRAPPQLPPDAALPSGSEPVAITEVDPKPPAVAVASVTDPEHILLPTDETSVIPASQTARPESEINVKPAPNIPSTIASQVAKANYVPPQPRDTSLSGAAAQPTSASSDLKTQQAPTPPAVLASQGAPTQVISSSIQSIPAASGSASTPSPTPVVALAKVPPPQYAQHIPGPNDEMQVEIKNARAPWYNKDRVSEIERSLLPEWFDSSAQHRTSDSYIKAREQILQMSSQLGNRFITNALIRRTVPGDAGSLNRLFHFLISYGFINADAINDSTPTTAALRETAKRSLPTKFEDALADAILKKHKTDPSGPMNWQGIADEIGDGATAADCQKGFLSLDLNSIQPSDATERSITPEPSDKPDPKPSGRQGGWNIESILANTDDKVLAPTVETALKQTSDLVQARNAVLTAFIASQAALKAVAEEDALGQVMAELTEKRMHRLEKRIELLNDVEGMMEAERMALELERRDLYTARCRHWFGGSS